MYKIRLFIAVSFIIASSWEYGGKKFSIIYESMNESHKHNNE